MLCKQYEHLNDEKFLIGTLELTHIKEIPPLPPIQISHAVKAVRLHNSLHVQSSNWQREI